MIYTYLKKNPLIISASFRVKLTVFLLAICLAGQVKAIMDFDELCRLFKNGTFIRKPATCDEYIECSDGKGTFHICESPLVFDASTQKCVKATTSLTKHCADPCEGLDGLWKADPTECQNFFYCDHGVGIPGHCLGSQHFNESSQSCMYGVDSICVDVANICDILPKDALFRYEDDCSKYYKCSSKTGKHTLQTCTGEKYFSVETGGCVPRAQVVCNAHPKTDVCLDSKKKNPVVGRKSDSATCRGYFICADLGSVPDLNPVWAQCAEGTFFDETLKRCAKPTSVYCTHNRCDGRGTMLVTSSTNDCHSYIECVNGIEVGNGTCHWDYFFDESLQSCVPNIIYDECCDGTDYV